MENIKDFLDEQNKCCEIGKCKEETIIKFQNLINDANKLIEEYKEEIEKVSLNYDEPTSIIYRQKKYWEELKETLNNEYIGKTFIIYEIYDMFGELTNPSYITFDDIDVAYEYACRVFPNTIFSIYTYSN